MASTLENIRSALKPYLSDPPGIVGIPDDLLLLLEDADESTRSAAEVIEGLLVQHALKGISEDSLKKKLRVLLGDPMPLKGIGTENTFSPLGAQGDVRFEFLEGYIFDLSPDWSKVHPASGDLSAPLPNSSSTATHDGAKVSLSFA